MYVARCDAWVEVREKWLRLILYIYIATTSYRQTRAGHCTNKKLHHLYPCSERTSEKSEIRRP